MSWENKDGRHCGLVCATCDKKLGRINLARTGMSIPECVLFERYLKETVELEVYPDWPEWMKQKGKTCAQLTSTKPEPNPIKPTKPTETHSVKLLDLSPRAHNALRRSRITTIGQLANMDNFELSEVRMLGVKSIDEIHKQLEELGLRKKVGQKGIL